MNLLSVLVLFVSVATVSSRLLPGTAAVYLTVRLGSQSISSFGTHTTGAKVMQALDAAVQLVAPGIEASSSIETQRADPRTSTGVLLDVRILMQPKHGEHVFGGAGKEAKDAARAMNGDSFLHKLRDLVKHAPRGFLEIRDTKADQVLATGISISRPVAEIGPQFAVAPQKPSAGRGAPLVSTGTNSNQMLTAAVAGIALGVSAAIVMMIVSTFRPKGQRKAMLSPEPEERSVERLLDEPNRLRQRRPSSEDTDTRSYSAIRQPAAKVVTNALSTIIGAAAGKPKLGAARVCEEMQGSDDGQMENVSLA